MAKYTVIGLVAAQVQVEVEADNPDDAIEKADLPSTGICHQCAQDVQVGDVYDFVVLDEAGNEVLGPDMPKPQPSAVPE